MKNPSDDRYAAVIVGAGPAGLFASLALAENGIGPILLVDAGPDIGQRRDDVGEGRVDYERGVGGAGLFSDGKLCLSLDVGGHLETSIGSLQRRQLLERIERTLLPLVPGGYQPPDLVSPRPAKESAARAGLDFKYYPVAHIGTDRCHSVVVRLRQLVASRGVEIRSDTRLVDLGLSGLDKVATLAGGGREATVRTRTVILAMGKVGAAQEAQLARSLGVATSNQAIYTGVRFETSAESLAPLFALSKDPKYSRRLSDGSKIKTHCASENGEVMTLRYDGLPLAGGQNYSRAKTGRSGFSILWNGLATDSDGSYATANRIMATSASQAKACLAVQRYTDLTAKRVTQADELKGLGLSCDDAQPGPLHSLYPPVFYKHMDDFLIRLSTLAPGVLGPESVVYGPAIEWWMDRIDVENPHMATRVPGLFVAGDGSGWSQGIVHAAATGLLAADGVIKDQWRSGSPSHQRLITNSRPTARA
jgi:uncharacterized FAD-dependent dehydrogenase